MSEILAEEAEGAAGYGTRGEALRVSGMRKSGYADFLNAENERRGADARAEALGALTAATKENELDYASYLEEYESRQDNRMSTVLSKILQGKFEGYTDAYRYAIINGLDEERADMIGKMNDSLSGMDFAEMTPTARMKMLTDLLTQGMDYKTAYYYARACGMSDSIAVRIAEYAEMARGGFVSGGIDIDEMLEDLRNESK